MTKIYQGVDIVEVSKFKKIFHGRKALISDIFSEREQEYCLSRQDPYLHFAGRFAAKEASLKALGIGMSGSGIDNALREIEVQNSSSGRPLLLLSGWTKKVSSRKGITQLTVSISHTGNYAVATVILS